MLITTLHETIFDYAAPIKATFTEARLWPVTDATQTCRDFTLSVDPMRDLTESRDYFGNMVLSFNILTPHRRVVLTGHSVVETHRNPFIPCSAGTEFEQRKAHLDFLKFDGPVQNLPELAVLVRDAGLPPPAHQQVQHPVNGWEQQTITDRIVASAQELNSIIHERFTYAPRSTHVHSTISEVFAGRQGVCQDFAHIFIAACRSVGLPARYVSGYLVTRRSRSAEGAAASHAWAEVLIPGSGWYAFDPTNNLLADDYYIKLAAGRDYRDVSPTRGIYNGKDTQSRLGVRVHTIVEDLGDMMDTARDADGAPAEALVG